MKSIWGWLIIGLMVLSCDDELTFNEQLARDQRLIDEYLDENGLFASEDPSGIRYLVVRQGDGRIPMLDSDVNVKYKTYLMDGKELIDQDTTGDVWFNLQQVVVGFRLGMQYVQEGGEIIIYAPSGLCYGMDGFPPIVPPNANMIFEVELIDARR
jgi:FKBP-type peptidyl-prolyl cis-trans isomerase